MYGVKAKDGSVELLMLASNNVCGRIPASLARLESLKCINLANNHISGPIPAELGLLLQLQTLQLHGNNLRGVRETVMASGQFLSSVSTLDRLLFFSFFLSLFLPPISRNFP